jgi:hypothetical protein
LRLTELPVDVLQNMLEYLPPETLSTIREASPGMRDMVDNYVERLVQAGELTDREGTELRDLEYRYEPSEILDNWGNNEFGRLVQPRSEADQARIQDNLDGIFRGYGSERNSFNEGSQALTIMELELQLDENTEEARKLKEDLYPYFDMLIRAGRLVDGEDIPIPTGTPAENVMELLKNGEARWLPPEVYVPPSEADRTAIMKSWDEHFWAFEEYNEGQPNTLTWYEPALNQNTREARKLENELNIYVQGLLEASRLVDWQNNPLPTDTPLSDVMYLLRNGEARWEPPPHT